MCSIEWWHCRWPWVPPNRPRSRSSRTKRLTWLFCRLTSSTSRRFYDSTRLGWFPIDLVDLRPFWSQLSARACSLAADAKNSVSKYRLMPSHCQFQLPSGRPSFPFLLPPLNIFVVGSCDHKMRSMRPVAKLLWPLVEVYQRHCGRENECGI